MQSKNPIFRSCRVDSSWIDPPTDRNGLTVGTHKSRRCRKNDILTGGKVPGILEKTICLGSDRTEPESMINIA